MRVSFTLVTPDSLAGIRFESRGWRVGPDDSHSARKKGVLRKTEMQKPPSRKKKRKGENFRLLVAWEVS